MDGDRGAVTVEAAVALGALAFVLASMLAGLAMVVDLLRCTDAAGEAARLVARGQRQQAESAVRVIAPGGARLAVRAEGDAVTVEVGVAPVGGLLFGARVRATAFALLEPGVSGAG
ncbi:hypothetical protein SAMN05421504_102405 [Amycolatopsis xylanica]|uniref:TadE-like protein n=1 Tax=Amycolatopsis xylanica TaxID=589385 RepID=A0A1H2Z7I6_9PSEU|nr:TadE family type IV pilus minor pilin [Amycolatopsis xylanica]SDX13287.1 hypothetical protein SAMN05421504_102405 [Amycolatopsis xylanica]